MRLPPSRPNADEMGNLIMRKSILTGAALLIAGASPGFARDYPWCARTGVTVGNPSCDYDTLDQCNAYLIGIGGTCIQNPAMAAAPMGDPRPMAAHRRGMHRRR
jgi:hypothetical protein